MKQYTEADLLKIAKRFHNTKRTYLLVDPLQGKHLAVSPQKALELFNTLGAKVRAQYPDARLVIGFAETATAVGMGVAEALSADCAYIHTTREDEPGETHFIEFSEEHSHAVEQKLAASKLREYLANTGTVVFVDDEISTGKTMINMVTRLKNEFPEISGKKLVVASVISRVSDRNMQKMQDCGLESVALLTLEETNYTGAVEKYEIHEAGEADGKDGVPAQEKCTQTAGSVQEPGARFKVCTVTPGLYNPRLGVKTGEYRANCEEFAARVIKEHFPEGAKGRVLVLGTEECMYPAMILGAELENQSSTTCVKSKAEKADPCTGSQPETGKAGTGNEISGNEAPAEVFTHSTTRSPIGICNDQRFPEYPVKSGFRLQSLYDAERTTYIYNLEKYDRVIIVTDSRQDPAAATTLVNALVQCGNDDILLVRG